MFLLSYLTVAILICLSGLSSATETAITGCSAGKLQQLSKEGNTGAGLIIKLLKNKDNVITALLITNNIVNIAATSLVTSLFIKALGSEGAAYATVFMSVLIIIVAEVIPKAMAIANPEKLALFIAIPLNILVTIFYPIIRLLHALVKTSMNLFGLDNSSVVSGQDEVRGVIDYQHQEGRVFKDDRDMLDGVLDLNYLTVSDLVVPRNQLQTLPQDLDKHELVTRALAIPYSRVPIWKDNKDNIVGMLHIRSLFDALLKNNFDYNKIDLDDILIKSWFVPETTLIRDQLKQFKRRKVHSAIVIDEYGDIQGIITLEDILEEIVGQIEDEYDKEQPKISYKSGGRILVSGDIPIRDLNKAMNWDLPEQQASTLAGLLMEELERIPEQGEKVTFRNLSCRIVKRAGNTIKTIQIGTL
jgi:Mg2+/Co2+ transporter CorB